MPSSKRRTFALATSTYNHMNADDLVALLPLAVVALVAVIVFLAGRDK